MPNSTNNLGLSSTTALALDTQYLRFFKQLKHKEDNRTMGVLLCKEGVSEYTLSHALPNELKTALPSMEAALNAPENMDKDHGQ